MKALSRKWPVVILFAIAATFLLLHHQNLNAQAQPQPQPPRPHWEYASLMTSARQSKWISADLRHTEDGDQGYIRLYTALGGKKPADKISLIDLLNLAGDQGWELTAIDGGEGPHQYLFKRLIP